MLTNFRSTDISHFLDIQEAWTTKLREMSESGESVLTPRDVEEPRAHRVEISCRFFWPGERGEQSFSSVEPNEAERECDRLRNAREPWESEPREKRHWAATPRSERSTRRGTGKRAEGGGRKDYVLFRQDLTFPEGG